MKVRRELKQLLMIGAWTGGALSLGLGVIPTVTGQETVETANSDQVEICHMGRTGFRLLSLSSQGAKRHLDAHEGDKLAVNGECICLLYTSPSPRDKRQSRMPSSA